MTVGGLGEQNECCVTVWDDTVVCADEQFGVKKDRPVIFYIFLTLSTNPKTKINVFVSQSVTFLPQSGYGKQM